MEVVGEVERDEDPRGRGVDAHVVHRVIEELGPRVAFDVVGVVVTPT